MANMTEASSTILLIAGGRTALSEELVHDRCTRLDVLASSFLGALNPALLRRDAKFVVVQPHHDLVTRLNSERLAKVSGNHNPAIFVDPETYLLFHDKPQPHMTAEVNYVTTSELCHVQAVLPPAHAFWRAQACSIHRPSA